MKHRNK